MGSDLRGNFVAYFINKWFIYRYMSIVRRENTTFCSWGDGFTVQLIKYVFVNLVLRDLFGSSRFRSGLVNLNMLVSGHLSFDRFGSFIRYLLSIRHLNN